MKDPREDWDGFAARLGEARRVCVLCDFDGTLTPLVERPDLAALSAPAAKVLRCLRENPRVTVGIVSGRALQDLRARVALDGLWYVGNHGYEILSPDGQERRFYEKEEAEFLAEVCSELGRATAGTAGVILENKGPVVAVHYRQVPEVAVQGVVKAFLSVVDRYHRRVMIARGSFVLEARLRSTCNKGTAVRYIRHELPAGALVVYFGDDLTDRDAFRALRDLGVSVCVGPDVPLADYALPDPGSVIDFLGRMEEALRGPRVTRSRPRKEPRPSRKRP